MCRMPAGSGLGSKLGVSRVIMGRKMWAGRWFWMRYWTGVLKIVHRVRKWVREPGSIIQLTQSCVYKVLVAVRGIAGNPLALGDLVEAVARAWRGVRRPGPWQRPRHGLLVWEDRGCGGGYRLTCQCRGRLWMIIRIEKHLSQGILDMGLQGWYILVGRQ